MVISAQPPRLHRILEAAASQSVDLAVIDTAPRVEQSAVAAAKAADLVLVPCRPAIYDLETVAATRDLVRAVAPTARLLCVLNGVPPRGPRQRQARELLADIGVPVCASGLGLRAAFDYAAAGGLSAREYEPRGKAAAEIAGLYATVRQLVDLPPAPQADSTTRRKDNSWTRRRVDLPPSPKTDLPTTRTVDLSTSPKRQYPECAGDRPQWPIVLTCAARSWIRRRAAIPRGTRLPTSPRKASPPAGSANAPQTSRAGKVSVTGYFAPEVRRQLRRLAADGDTTIQALLGEALNDLFAKHRLPEIVAPE